MTRSASSFAADGTPTKRSAGRSPAPEQVKRTGIRAPGANAGLETVRRAAGAAGALPTLSPPPHPAGPMVTRRTNPQPDGRAIAGIIARMRLFALRGATTVDRNEPDAIGD